MKRIQAISVAYNNGQPVAIVSLEHEPAQARLDPSKIYVWRSLGFGRGHSRDHVDRQLVDTAGKFCGYYGPQSSMGDTLEAVLALLGVRAQPTRFTSGVIPLG